MKKLITSITLFLCIAMLLFQFPLKSSAYATLNGRKMIGGVGSSGNNTRYYWINTSSFNTTWEQRAVTAMYEWCHTGTSCGTYTSIWFARTLNQHSSVLDFQRDDNLGQFVYGKTTLYKTAGESNMITNPYTNYDDWVWAKCTINVYSCNYGTSSSGQSIALTKPKKKAIFVHEAGHAFGLDDLLGSSNMNKIMYLGQYDCTVVSPTNDDCDGVNSLYGGYNP